MLDTVIKIHEDYFWILFFFVLSALKEIILLTLQPYDILIWVNDVQDGRLSAHIPWSCFQATEWSGTVTFTVAWNFSSVFVITDICE